jgi:hypothetical protein
MSVFVAESRQNSLHYLLKWSRIAPASAVGSVDRCRPFTGAGDWENPKRILLPVRNLQFWIEQNILLILKAQEHRNTRGVICFLLFPKYWLQNPGAPQKDEICSGFIRTMKQSQMAIRSRFTHS